MQPVKVQCDTKKHLKSIFSYDGTDRIRFTGQGQEALSQPVNHRHPEDKITIRYGYYTKFRKKVKGRENAKCFMYVVTTKFPCHSWERIATGSQIPSPEGKVAEQSEVG